MPIYQFSQKSLTKIDQLSPNLALIVRDAMDLQIMDFTVLCGLRSLEEQKKLFKQGRTRTMNSKHLGNKYGLSDAVDLAPFPIDWNDAQRFHRLAGIIQSCAAQRAIPLRWGGNWDGDNDTKDQNFIDLPHFELLS